LFSVVSLRKSHLFSVPRIFPYSPLVISLLDSSADLVQSMLGQRCLWADIMTDMRWKTMPWQGAKTALVLFYRWRPFGLCKMKGGEE
jgi:hypothetical protein